MRILYASNSTSCQGGAELNLFKICSEFDKKYSVTVILPDQKGIYNEYKKNNINTISINAIRPSIKSGIFNLIKFFFLLPITIIKIIKVIKDNKIDIVHTNDIIDFPAMIATKFTKAKLVSHIRFIINEDNIQKKIFSIIYKLCSDKIICVSNAVKENWFPDLKKAIVIYDGGPNLSLFNNNKEKKNKKEIFNIVTVGKLVSISGHENIIRAISKLKINIRDKIKLTIVGGSVEGYEEYEDMLYKLADSNKNINFTGYTNKVYDFLQEADLFCFTPNWEHAFPSVILEAMAMKLPILAYEKGGIPEQVKNGINGFLVNDVCEISQKIEELYNDNKLLNELSNNSYTFLQDNFSIPIQIFNTNKVYDEVLK